MRILFVVIILTSLFSCQTSQKITQGLWSGTLSPGNHPDMENPLSYQVKYIDDQLTIALIGPDAELIQTTNLAIEKEILSFDFIEPEENQQLECKFEKMISGKYRGRCTDSNGKWAILTMNPPES